MGDEVKPTDGELRIELHLLCQRINAVTFAMLAAGAGRVLRRSAFVTVVVAVVMMMVAAVVFRQHGGGMVLAMRMVPATAEGGMDEQHGGRQIG